MQTEFFYSKTLSCLSCNNRRKDMPEKSRRKDINTSIFSPYIRLGSNQQLWNFPRLYTSCICKSYFYWLQCQFILFNTLLLPWSPPPPFIVYTFLKKNRSKRPLKLCTMWPIFLCLRTRTSLSLIFFIGFPQFLGFR